MNMPSSSPSLPDHMAVVDEQHESFVDSNSYQQPQPLEREEEEEQQALLHDANNTSTSSSTTTSTTTTTVNRIGLAMFACLQNALVGGLIFGWASIDRTMLKASEEQGGASLTSAETTQLFAYASCTAMMAPLLVGPLLDAFGPRLCLAFSHLLVVVGCAGFALSHVNWHYVLSVVLISFGGPGVGLGIIHNANLFPQNQFLAVSVLSGSITLSFSMLAVLETIWDNYHVSFRTLFGGYSCLAAMSMVGTLCLSPHEPYQAMDEDNPEGDLFSSFDSRNFHPSLEQEYIQATIQTYAHHHQHHLLMTDQSLTSMLRRRDIDIDQDDNMNDDDDDDYVYQDIEGDEEEQPHQHLQTLKVNTQHQHQHQHTPLKVYHRTRSFFQSQAAIESGNETAFQFMSLKDQPFLNQVQSTTFARAVTIFVITSFLANFTIASLNTELEDLNEFTHTQQHVLSQVFTWCLSLGMVYAVFVGWLMDHAGLEVCTLLTLVLGQVSTACMMLASFPSSWLDDEYAFGVMIFGFALYSLFRQFLYPVFLAYITARLGFKYFGILSGIAYALSGMAQWFMADLVKVIHYGGTANVGAGKEQGGWWLTFHIVQIVLLGVLMIIPIADHRDIQRREALMEEFLQQLQKQQHEQIMGKGVGTGSSLSISSATSTPILSKKKSTGKISPTSVDTFATTPSPSSNSNSNSPAMQVWKQRLLLKNPSSSSDLEYGSCTNR